MATKGVKSNKKEWTRIKQNLRRGKVSVNIGWFEGQNYGPDNGGLPYAQVAQWVEEGHINGGMFSGTITPPRPAIRTLFLPTLKEMPTDFLDKVIPMVVDVAEGKMSWKRLHERIAPRLVMYMQYALEQYNVIPNSATTIKLKGFNNPWYESGNLIQNVKFDIDAWSPYRAKNG